MPATKSAKTLLLFGLFILSGALNSMSANSAPFVYTSERIETAKETAKLHPWAKAEYESIMQTADDAVSQSQDVLSNWFYATTPNDQCSCPNCGEYWLNQIWDWSSDTPDQITCKYCDTVVTTDSYPKTRSSSAKTLKAIQSPTPSIATKKETPSPSGRRSPTRRPSTATTG